MPSQGLPFVPGHLRVAPSPFPSDLTLSIPCVPQAYD
jgi:hypothetical protein